MNSKKSDLEIIYNLRWKSGPSGNGGVKESMIGVYDIPATTLNWEVFKSYLLKNSGTDGNDVKISYLMDNGREYPIQSQTEFQVALYAFRRKARAGEPINLRLERISDQPNHKNVRHSNDVETQFDNNDQCSFISTTCCASNPIGDSAPEWFVSSLAQLKKEITEDVTTTITDIVLSALTNVKSQGTPQPVPTCSYHHSRRGKSEKRLRKASANYADCTSKLDAKDLMKSLKLDGKLEKCERKANKIKEKCSIWFNASRGPFEPYPAKATESQTGHCGSAGSSYDKEEAEEKKMDAQPIKTQETVPHMLGGEIYLHRWDVKNTGELPWTSKTYLQYTWGSKALEPMEKTITVPYLKPGDTGLITARLVVPRMPGRYECYWQFMHKGRRFGRWLGAQLIVDPFDLKGNKSVLETSSKNIALEADEGVSFAPEEIVHHYDPATKVSQAELEELRESQQVWRPYAKAETRAKEKLENDLAAWKSYERMNLLCSFLNQKDQATRPLLSDSDSDSNQDNQSVISVDGSNDNSSSKSLKEDYVLVPSCFKIDNLEAEEASENILINTDVPSTSGNQTQNQEKIVKPKQSELVEKAEEVKVSDNKLPEDFDTNNNNEKDSTKASTSAVELENCTGKRGNSEGSSEGGDSDYEVGLVVEEDGKSVKDMVTKVKKGTKKDGFIFVKLANRDPKNEILQLPKTILNSDLVQVIDDIEKTKISSDESKPSTSAATPTPTPEPSLTPTRVQPQTPEKNKEVLLDLSVASSEKSQPGAPEAVKPQKKTTEVRQGEGVPNDVAQAAAVADEFMSHCSAAGSSFSEANQQAKRLFVFPTDCPGYEVVYPVLDHNEEGEPMVYSQYYPPDHHYSFVTNYQQTPAHLRANPFGRTDEAEPVVAYDKPLAYNPAYNDYYEQTEQFYQQQQAQSYPTYGSTHPVAQNVQCYSSQSGPYATRNTQSVYADASSQNVTQAATTGNYVDYSDVDGTHWRYFGPRDTQTAATQSQNTRDGAGAMRSSDYAAAAAEFEVAQNLSRAQVPPQQPPAPVPTVQEPARAQEAPVEATASRTQPESGHINILPEGIVNGAVHVASSAINTAKNVMGMFRPQAPGRWVQGHWISANAQTPREANLQALHEMGFWNRDLNGTLLARFNDDLNRVVTELVQ